jgi:outer membrane murein-binding lipoprotein Lpp
MNGMRVFAAVAAMLLLAGCGNKNKSTLEPTVQSQNNDADSGEPGARARELRAELPAFQAAYAPLPARNDEQNRKQIADAFVAAGRLLSTLEGPNPGGAFRQQLRIIDNNRQRLASASESLAIEPTVNAGLRALYNALVDIRMDQFAGDPGIIERLDTMRSRVNDLDTVRGPLHRLVAAQVFRGAGDVIEAMATLMENRSHNQQASPTQPATAPAGQ